MPMAQKDCGSRVAISVIATIRQILMDAGIHYDLFKFIVNKKSSVAAIFLIFFTWGDYPRGHWNGFSLRRTLEKWDSKKVPIGFPTSASLSVDRHYGVSLTLCLPSALSKPGKAGRLLSRRGRNIRRSRDSGRHQ